MTFEEEEKSVKKRGEGCGPREDPRLRKESAGNSIRNRCTFLGQNRGQMWLLDPENGEVEWEGDDEQNW